VEHIRILKFLTIVVLICGACGCAGLNTTEERALSGGAIGSVAGLDAAAIIGAPLLVGVAAGAAAGAVGGVVLDEVQRR
jgi:osmotically inducible lipoprotein OsmB